MSRTCANVISKLTRRFCWGGAAQLPPSAPQRTHSSSSLDAYFSEARANTPGSTTPRPVTFAAQGEANYGTYGKKSGTDTPSSTGSYFTSYTSTPGRQEDMEAVEDSLRLERGSPRIMGMRAGDMSMGRMSPPVAC